MIHLIPITRIITAIAVLYAVTVPLVIWLTNEPNATSLQNAAVAFSGSSALNLILLFFVYFAWRWIWSAIPILNRLVFPDLNGMWDMTISWNWKGKSGTAHAVAHVKQDFLKLSMEVVSDMSESETLMAKPKKDPESGRPILYYVYRTVPKQVNGIADLPYDGAAILKLDHSRLDALCGNYFTSRSTSGYFELRKRTTEAIDT